jgi:hypothetical protein
MTRAMAKHWITLLAFLAALPLVAGYDAFRGPFHRRGFSNSCRS